MEQGNQVPNQVVYVSKPPVPNSTAVLVLGIISIVLCFCYGIFSIVIGIVALVLSSKGLAVYRESPESYSESSLKNLNAGKICAIIGLCLGGLVVLLYAIYFAILGTAIFSLVNFWDYF